ncbi:MAG TPA: hypothetical protein VIU12_31540 [Chryseolinea sp.]
MARASNSSVLSGLSGIIGEVVVRQTRHGVIIAKRPEQRKRKLSKAEQKTRKRFAAAAAYGKKVLADFKKKNPKAKTVINGKSIYNAAVAEYLKRR